jgi:ribonucleoside-diphosphate reductase alpha chain
LTSVVEKAEERAGTYVQKRDGRLEPADLNKIVRAIQNHSQNLRAVDSIRIATKTISGLYDGTKTEELDLLSIQTASELISEEPEYSKLAARMLASFISKEVLQQDIATFSQSIDVGFKQGLINQTTYDLVSKNKRKLNEAINNKNTDLFEYFGLKTVYDRYLLRHPTDRFVLETPQYFLMRVACGLSNTANEAIELYNLLSSLKYMTSTPTLFNSGTSFPQMSSCFLLDSPEDDLRSIYQKYSDIAMLSKYSGGIGVSFSRVRSDGSLIRGTNGYSNGIIPWLKTLDSSVAAVNQGGKRKGAAAVYLETWHADIEAFLELRENTGDQARRAHNLMLANWVPDLFMERVRDDAVWSLFDPKVMPELVDTYGDEFKTLYEQAEVDGKYIRQLKARDLYATMIRSLSQTGNGWMTFKDTANRKSNQTGAPGNIIHLSNLCTEILEVTTPETGAVCNLGSLNLGAFVTGTDNLDLGALMDATKVAVKYLDRVIDRNYYTVDSSGVGNKKWRPIGLGIMGFQDVLFKMEIPFESEDAERIARQVQEAIYFAALEASCELAEEFGAHDNFAETRAANGVLQFDLWDDVQFEQVFDWKSLKARIIKSGLRNSLLLAIAPTATIASICGAYECIEPQLSNLFKRETMSGEFLQVNKYLVEDLKKLDLWTEEVRNEIKLGEGSIQGIEVIPQRLRDLYKTAWEISNKAVINVAAARGPFLDQSQSLNLFVESPTIGSVSSMYMYAWEKGLKTTYYLRSRPATKIRKATTISAPVVLDIYTDAEALACSLENPEECEACQ